MSQAALGHTHVRRRPGEWAAVLGACALLAGFGGHVARRITLIFSIVKQTSNAREAMALRQEWVYVKGKQVVVNHFTGVSKDTVPQADLCLQWVLQADQVQELQAGLLRKYHSGGQSTCMPSASGRNLQWFTSRSALTLGLNDYRRLEWSARMQTAASRPSFFWGGASTRGQAAQRASLPKTTDLPLAGPDQARSLRLSPSRFTACRRDPRRRRTQHPSCYLRQAPRGRQTHWRVASN
jgi:hypothetical protein